MIKITQGRQQPYAVWKGRQLVRFYDNYSDAVAENRRLNPGEEADDRAR